MTETNSIESKKDINYISKMQQWIGSDLAIKITDGRELIGQIQCIDQQKNIVLSNTYEHKIITRKDAGMIIVPGKHIVSVKLKQIKHV